MKSAYGASLALVLCLSFLATSFAADRSTVRGTIKDPLGAVVSNAHVALVQSGKVLAATTTDGSGGYGFSSEKWFCIAANLQISHSKRRKSGCRLCAVRNF